MNASKDGLTWIDIYLSTQLLDNTFRYYVADNLDCYIYIYILCIICLYV